MSKKDKSTPSFLKDYDVEEVEPDSLILPVGDEVFGVYMGTDISSDADGNSRERFIIRDQEDELLKALPNATELKRKMMHIDQGDLIRIVRKADYTTNTGRTMKKFSVMRYTKKGSTK